MQICPCGINQSYENCCGRYIDSPTAAPSPEALMRSRYTAFVLAKLEYLADTMKGKAALHFNPSETNAWLEKVTWLSLTVTSHKMKTPQLGYVIFEARYQFEGKLHIMREKSEFHKVDNRWYYVDGKSLNPHG